MKTVIASVKSLETARVNGSQCSTQCDNVSIEEPLEILLGIRPTSQQSTYEHILQQVAVTMRTPGNDRELAAGFLFTEGIIAQAADIESIEVNRCNTVHVNLKEQVEVDPLVFGRHSFMASSCGVCGKKSIAAITVRRQFSCRPDSPLVSADLVHSLIGQLRAFQADFKRTGGLHASCLFDSNGRIKVVKEDVGRHNALDKVIGYEFLAGNLPLNDSILMVSGRASFELVQKAAHAGIAVIAAVGAPSSLAVKLAEECDMTLLGFVRDDRFNIYTGKHRITGI
jgi:FdhD protein